jgi:putative hydrolase of the HAD superfamily
MTTLSFDLDGTLVDQEYSEWIWRHAIPDLVAKKRMIGLEDAKTFVFNQYDSIGDASLEWYQISYWFNRFRIDEHWKAVMENHADKIGAYPEVPEVLDRLKDRFELVIISNAAREFVSIEMEKANLYKFFSRVFSATSDFGEVKKTGRFYGKVCGILGVEPSELIHVGDHWTFDYLVPKKRGIRTYFLDRDGIKHGDDTVRDLLEFERRL